MSSRYDRRPARQRHAPASLAELPWASIVAACRRGGVSDDGVSDDGVSDDGVSDDGAGSCDAG
jgi:hypothetical protein